MKITARHLVPAALALAAIGVGPAVATPALDVRITSGPEGTVAQDAATLTFEANEFATFECSLDGGALTPCTSPQTYSGLTDGDHSFTVKATDRERRNSDSDSRRWTVRRPAGPPPPSPPGPPPPSPPGAPPPTLVGGGIEGPSTVQFGEPAAFSARVAGAVTRYQWDLDGSGRFATDTGARPVVSASLAEPGDAVVRLRATGPGGSVEASRAVTVRRPTVAALEFSPALPRPGEKVQLRVVWRGETGFKPLYYAWRIGGLKPLSRTLSLGRKRSTARSAATGGGYSIQLSDAQPTAKPTLTRSFPKRGVYRVEVGVAGPGGTQTTVYADVKVVAGRSLNAVSGPERLAEKGYPKLGVKCEVIPFAFCGAISVETNPGPSKAPITFTNASPDLHICVDVPTLEGGLITEGQAKLSKFFAKKDLPYPSPEQFFNDGSYTQPPLGPVAGKGKATGRRGARAALLKTVLKKFCRTIESQAVSWDFGDGGKIVSDGKAPPGAEAPDPFGSKAKVGSVVKHTYQAAGKRTVTLVVRRFYLNKEKLGLPDSDEYNTNVVAALGNADAEQLLASGVIKSYLVKTSIEMEVLDQFCGVLKLNGIPARAFLSPGYDEVSPLASGTEDGCFLRFRPDGADHDVYRTIPGQRLSLNGIMVEPAADDVAVVDDQTARVTALDGGDLSLTFFSSGSTLGSFPVTNAGTTPQIIVPKPKFNADLKRTVAALPDYGGALAGGKVGGFEVTGAKLFLAPDTSALARLSVKPREPLNGATPQVVVGGYQAKIASHVTPDFLIDLRDIDIGPFKTKEFTLAHYPGGEGWQGGGLFSLDLGGTSYDLNAKFLPDPGIPPKQCKDLGVNAGPSGLSLPDIGGFDFAGGSVIGAKIIVGPAEIYCFGASFKKKPFVLVGVIGAHIPPQTNFIGVDLCVVVAVLKSGQSASGCPGAYYKASSSGVWIAGRGKVTLLDSLTLGDAGFDVYAFADDDSTSAFGKVYFQASPYYIDGKVTGLVRVKPPPAGFEFTGEVELGILGVGCPVCIDVKAVVSSKGIAACADVLILSGGFVFKWSGDLDLFAGCDWDDFSSIKIASTLARRLDLRTAPSERPPLGAVAQAGVRVRGGQGVAFKVDGAGGAPRVVLVTPSGQRIVGPGQRGRAYQRIGGVGFLTADRVGQTIVTVPTPKSGAYRIEAQPGSPAITGLSTARKLPQRRILARVTGGGAQRRLAYSIRPIPGQSVRFVEEGATVGRAIGEVATNRGGAGTLPFPSGYGTAGKRMVSAIISQDGVPIQKIPVTSYRAPGPPAVPAPKAVGARRLATGDLRTCWKAVPDARLYEVTATSTDGRVLRRRTTEKCATFDGFDSSVGAQVSVEAVTAYGSSKSRGKAKLPRVPLPAPRLALQ